MPSAAEEAIARAKAIAARLAGTAAVSATTPQASAAPVPPPAGASSTYYAPATSTAATAPASTAASAGVVQVDAATAKAAEEALAMAFGPSAGAGAGAPAAAAAKRKRWGDDGDAAGGAATAASAAEDPAAKKPALDPAVARTADLAQQALLAAMSGGGAGANAKVTRKLPIPTEQFPGYNFVGLLIGPGGSKQRELVQRAGGNVKISVRGDSSGGSSGAEPLHVLLEGSKDCVDKADEMISELLKDPKKADEEKARQLGGLKGAMPAAGVDGQYGPPSGGGAATTSSYTPKPVASLLGLGGGAASGHYGPTPGSTTFVEEKIGVPNGVVGFIIGRGGESILSMQRRSGCKVQIQKEFEMAPGSTQRVITLTADTKDSVDMARGIIEGMVKEKMLEQQQKNAAGSGGGVGGPGLGGGAGGGPGVDPQTARMNQAIADGHAVVKVQVPNADVGLIIGRGGSQIKMIQDRSGANVQIPKEADADNPAIRTITVTHPNQGGADFAKQLIEEILKEKQARQGGGGMGGAGAGGGMGGGMPGGTTVQIHIPDKDVGLCIGKQGATIKAMQEKSGCRINIPAQPTPGLGYRVATCIGPPEKCAEVQSWIQRIGAEQSSNFITGYGMGGMGGYGQQQPYGQQQQPYGQQGHYGGHQQQDNSAAWGAYYANQAAASAPAAAAANAPAPAPAAASGANDQYYDDFFRYAAHYGESAARQYYGAWSPPEGTPNPYGNASPEAAAAAVAAASKGGDAAAASAPAPAPAAAAAAATAKDSSVRQGVSNLPAWMTKK